MTNFKSKLTISVIDVTGVSHFISTLAKERTFIMGKIVIGYYTPRSDP